MLFGASPTVQAFLATLFTWMLTALGASLVFLVPKSMTFQAQRKLLDAALGFAAGVMLAASYWSLLAPALEFAEHSGTYGAHTYIPVAIGIVLGAGFVYGADRFIPEGAGDAVEVLSASAAGDAGSSKKRDRELVSPSSASSAAPAPLQRQQSTRKRNASSNRLNKLTTDDAMDEMEANRKDQPQRGGGTSSKKKARSSPPPGTPTTGADEGMSASRKKKLGAASAAIPPIAESTEVGAAGVDDDVDTNGQSARERQQSWHRILLLVIAIVIHNFPEGLAVGVGFGALNTLQEPEGLSTAGGLQQHATNLTVAAHRAYHAEYTSVYADARNLAIGIGLQNFPEGLAVSLPLLRVGYSRSKAFWYGQLSGMVEPIGGVLGACLISYMQPVLPYALAFAAGAMIFVVVEDLVPETRAPGGYPTLASWGVIVGFITMMAMDVAL